jgi:hypothetical protein
MASRAPKSKSAMDKLVDFVSGIRAEARERMSAEEFEEAERKFDEVVDKVRARASRGRKRETA